MLIGQLVFRFTVNKYHHRMIDDLMTDEKASDFTLNQRLPFKQGGRVREL